MVCINIITYNIANGVHVDDWTADYLFISSNDVMAFFPCTEIMPMELMEWPCP